MTTSKRAPRVAADDTPVRKTRTVRKAVAPAEPPPEPPVQPKAKRAKAASAVEASSTPPTPRRASKAQPPALDVMATLESVGPRLRAKAVQAEQGLVSGLVHSIQDLPTKLLSRLGTASDLAAVLVKAQMPKPANKALVDQAAVFLRDLREAAQLSVDDLAKALTLEDASLLSMVESGKVGLPFDIILRMATVLGKNDPVGFILKVTRAYNPGIWATLDKLGIGKLVVQAGREREFANIYRANEAARGLNDAEFAAALRFVAASFDSAVVFQQQVRQGSAKG
ncbi:MAG TPA: helix-turn-helix transcriptional regulator [Burkholderiaceae bacterium]|nr:helix-turn-helix transcriptional regulator [Burkholderiaceae bacterium]